MGRSTPQKLDDFRVMMEEAAAKHEVDVSIHILPGTGKTATSKIATKIAGTDAITVKKVEGAIYTSTLRTVKQEMESKGLGNTIKKVRQTKSGELLKTVARKPARGEARQKQEALQSKLGRKYVQVPKQKPEGIVHIKDIEVLGKPDEVKKAITSVLGHNEGDSNIYVASLHEGFTGAKHATIHLPKQDMERLLKLRTVRTRLSFCRVMPLKEVVT